MAHRARKFASKMALLVTILESGVLAHCTSQGATYDLKSRLSGAATALVKDEHDVVVRELRDPAAIAALAQWAGVRPGWSEHPIRFPWTPSCCAVEVEFHNKGGGLMGGIGVGEQTLWYYPSIGATTRISSADRESFFRLMHFKPLYSSAIELRLARDAVEQRDAADEAHGGW